MASAQQGRALRLGRLMVMVAPHGPFQDEDRP